MLIQNPETIPSADFWEIVAVHRRLEKDHRWLADTALSPRRERTSLRLARKASANLEILNRELGRRVRRAMNTFA